MFRLNLFCPDHYAIVDMTVMMTHPSLFDLSLLMTFLKSHLNPIWPGISQEPRFEFIIFLGGGLFWLWLSECHVHCLGPYP